MAEPGKMSTLFRNVRVLENSPLDLSPRKCLWCGQTKPLDQFVKNPRIKTGRAAQCKRCHSQYERHRQAAIKQGTWKPTRKRRSVPDATRTPTLVEIAWAAGFLEAEGYFCRSVSSGPAKQGSEHVNAAQVHPESLYKLQELFGGTISKKNAKKRNIHSDIFIWQVYGERARTVVSAVEPFMSSRRREQIRKAFKRND